MVVREANPSEFRAVGELLTAAYGSLLGFPGPTEQPDYYEMLSNVGMFATRPDTRLFVAVEGDRLAGAVVYFTDMAQYGAGGSGLANAEANTAAFRLLAVHPDARGLGVGRALVGHCIARARAEGRRQIVIHSTDVMTSARKMYVALGFARAPEFDFAQDEFPILGFRLTLG